MTKPRITRIELQGFRSFGQSRQILDLPDSVAALWGGNSQGKTSFAEALEFLLTGQIARRELLASAKDEFIEAIRNCLACDF
jgi:recombinational DNA repair ATPase RecF